jgi:Fic family protein
MLIPLYLFDRKLLQSPMFYLSEYLEANRQEYYDRLLAVSRDGDWTGWCRFFLEALQRQALANETKARKILTLYQQKKDWIVDLTHSPYAVRALDWFFSTPIFKTPDFVTSADIPKPTANRIVRLAKENGLLRELTPGSGRRPAVLAFSELLNIAEGRAVF